MPGRSTSVDSTPRDEIIVNGDVGAAGGVYGDAKEVSMTSGGQELTLGSDTITIKGNILGDGDGEGAASTVSGDAYEVQIANSGHILTFGNDTITINGDFSGLIYGDYCEASILESETIKGGEDTITVNGNLSGSIYGGEGNDTIDLKGGFKESSGSGMSVDGGSGEDIISVTITDATSGDIAIYGGDGDGNGADTEKDTFNINFEGKLDDSINVETLTFKDFGANDVIKWTDNKEGDVSSTYSGSDTDDATVVVSIDGQEATTLIFDNMTADTHTYLKEQLIDGGFGTLAS